MRSFTSRTVSLAIGRDALGAFAQDAGQVAGVGGDLAVALLERLQVRDHHFGHLLLQVAVAHAGEVRLHLLVGPAGEGLVDGEQVAHAGAQACRNPPPGWNRWWRA